MATTTAKIKKDGKIASYFNGFAGTIKNNILTIGRALKYGDFKTRLSFIFMGFGNIFRGQIMRGAIFFVMQLAYIFFFSLFGITYLSRITTLGTEKFYRVFDEARKIYINRPGDNSMLILLFSVLTIFITIGFLMLYFANIKSAYKAQLLQAEGKKLPSFKEDFKTLKDENFHITLLALPTLGAIIFTVLPLVFMILMAFTNFDRNHQPPGNLFTWVGFQNFKDVFWQNPVKSKTFFSLLSWTLTWAFFATFTNYIGGMVLALMINKKGIKFKKFWRTCFIVSIAVPAFVTLLLMSKMLDNLGPINVLLQQVLGWTNEPIQFLTNGDIARVTIIFVNIWIGVPYTLLITSGILMNIPADLYESARIDGAGAFKQFTKITLPYMIFITTPYLISQFISNINNFNVIYFLTGGGPLTLDYFQAGKTDLLVTWLYRLTVTEQNYSLASTIGIIVFVICAVISLVTFNLTASAKKEDTFS